MTWHCNVRATWRGDSSSSTETFWRPKNAAGFVDLGVGDHSIAIRGVLTAIGAQRKTRTQPGKGDVRVWIDRHRMAAEFGDLLLGATRASGD